MLFKLIHRIILSLLPIYFFLACREETQELTYQDIAPIIYKKCSVCHRPEQAGPFNLLTYSDVKKYANRIKAVIEHNIMPPWPADTSYSRFANEVVLTKNEKEKILQWIHHQCPAGDTNVNVANTETFVKNIHRKPDLTIRFRMPIHLKGDGTDHFFVVKMPYQLQKDTFVQYVEFIPHQKKLVHHVNGHLLRYDEHRKFNYFEGISHVEEPVQSYMEAYKQMHLVYTDVKSDDPQKILPALIPNTVYYLPGFMPLYYREDIGGFYLPRHGVFFLNDIHYGPTHHACSDSSYVNIYFAPKRPKRRVYEGQMGTNGMSKITPPLIIPPNTIRTFTTSLLIPADISILAVNPHMHLLGQSFIAFAITPHRDTIPLIKIPKWNFNWQYYYIYKKPVIIPKNSLIVAIGTYNNTTQNPYNPNYPPIEVKEGDGFHSMKTTDEMFQFFFQYMVYQKGDDTLVIQK